MHRRTSQLDSTGLPLLTQLIAIEPLLLSVGNAKTKQNKANQPNKKQQKTH